MKIWVSFISLLLFCNCSIAISLSQSEDSINHFEFSSSTNIAVSPSDPKITNITISFYSSSDCSKGLVGSKSFPLDSKAQDKFVMPAGKEMNLEYANYSFCAQAFNYGDGNANCLAEFNQTNSVQYTFSYNQYDLSGNTITNSYCKSGKMADINTKGPCTIANYSTCAYPNNGKIVNDITVPFGAGWWDSCYYNSYSIDPSGNYWKLKANCRDAYGNSSWNFHKSTLCYGDISSLNGNCQSTYAEPNYSGVCSSGNGTWNSNGHVSCQ